MADEKSIQIWQPVAVTKAWLQARTAKLDIISPSWFEYRKTLGAAVLSNGPKSFMERLKRQHAIETGVIERLYDLSQGVTETLIAEGFREELISYGESSIPAGQLIDILRDHEEAVNMVFDFIKDERPLGKTFLHELHKIVTRHQQQVEVVDSLGNRSARNLLKGQFKQHPNNPRRVDGTVFQYCPPEQVESQATQMLDLYAQMEMEKRHPAIMAAWLHHAFTIIHPYQDGNGRVSRLLTTLVLIRHGLFPFTVPRQEKAKYIDALEAADRGDVQEFVDIVCIGQKINIENILSDKPLSNELNIAEAAKALVNKIEKVKEKQKQLIYFDKQFNTLIQIIKSKADDIISALILNGLNAKLNADNIAIAKIDELIAQRFNYQLSENKPSAFVSISFPIENKEETKEDIYYIYINLHRCNLESIVHLSSNYEHLEGSMPEVIIPIKPMLISLESDVSVFKEEIELFVNDLFLLGIKMITAELE